jgi:hypothetical protein
MKHTDLIWYFQTEVTVIIRYALGSKARSTRFEIIYTRYLDNIIKKITFARSL